MADQTPTEIDAADKKALTAFVMDNDELVQLETLLGRFNIFRVLRAAHNEIRHSNMLAWLLDPEETHGLGDRFLRRWLMEVVHDAAETGRNFDKLPSPIEVDVLDIEYVEVAREHANIDLLLSITTVAGSTWVICIENKVKAVQGKKQLEGYRTYVEHKYPSAEHALFIFLTKNDETPNDPKWIASTYSEVANVLGRCLAERIDTIGPEPRLLMTQYQNLLTEDFVDETESAVLARKIYQKHKKAIDLILENRQDLISDASADMQDILKENAGEFGIVLSFQNKGWIRFLPKEWDVPQNSGGSVWGANSRFAVCEICFWTKTVELHVTLGQPPAEWAALMWERTATPPFKRERKLPAAKYMKLEKVRSDIAMEALSEMEPEDRRARLQSWVKDELSKARFRQIVEAVREQLPKLKAK